MSHNKMSLILADERIGRLLFKLTLPAFMGMFVMTLYNVVDTIFIGHYVGPLGIAGLTIVFPIQMFAIGVGQMSGMGGASLISRLLGRQETGKAEMVLGNALASAAILSIIVLIVGFSQADYWLMLIGASDAILPYAREYLVIILFGMVFMVLAMSMNGLVRSEGNARAAMVGVIIGAVLNIILDAIFIISLNMGVRGAALATVIAQFISFVYFIRLYLSGKNYLKIRLKNLVLNPPILKQIYAIGISSLTMILAASLSIILVNRTLLFYGGDYAVSSFGILHRIMMFAMMPGMVIGQGLQPILGFNFGAGRYHLALRAIKLALAFSTAICSLAFVMLFFFPDIFIRIFTTDQVLLEMASHAARRVFLLLYLLGISFISSLIFVALGKALKAFIISIARPALFLIPALLVFPRFWGLDGVWFAFPASDGLTVILALAFLIPQIRDLRKGAVAGQQASTGEVSGMAPSFSTPDKNQSYQKISPAPPTQPPS